MWALGPALTLPALLLVVAAGLANVAPAPGAEDATLDRIETHVADGLRANRVPGGALAVVTGEGEVHLRGFGVVERGGDEVTPDTPFIIGSVSKSMTALAVHQLAEEGRFDLDDPLVDHLGWFEVEPAEWSTRVTIRHLLQHSSGLPPLAGAPATTWMADVPIAEAAREVVGAQLATEPGTAWTYTNANYVLLGALIEEVTGRPYAEQLEDRVFAPLGMSRSTARLDEARELGLRDGHRFVFGIPVPHLSYREGLVPSGLVASTARDLSRYLRALVQGGELDGTRVLSAAGVAAMLAPAMDATVGPWAKAPSAAYGSGWFVGGEVFGPTPVVFHPGASPDFGATAAMVPAEGSALVLLVNAGPRIAVPGAAGAIDRIGAGAVSLLTGSEPAAGGTVADAYRVATPVLALLLAGSLALAIRSPSRGRRGRLHLAVAVGSLALGVAVLAVPTLGLGWRQSWLWAPDLTAVAAAIGVLCVVAGVRRLTARRRPRPTTATPSSSDPAVPLARSGPPAARPG